MTPPPFLGLPDVVWELLSYVGFLALLGAFGLLSMGRLKREGLAFFLMNAGGSGILAFYSAKLGSPALTALEAAWCAIAIGGYVAAHRKQRRPQ